MPTDVEAGAPDKVRRTLWTGHGNGDIRQMGSFDPGRCGQLSVCEAQEIESHLEQSGFLVTVQMEYSHFATWSLQTKYFGATNCPRERCLQVATPERKLKKPTK